MDHGQDMYVKPHHDARNIKMVTFTKMVTTMMVRVIMEMVMMMMATLLMPIEMAFLMMIMRGW